MIRLTYDPDLVEEAVLLAERTAPPDEARAFRRERDRIYELPDSEVREARFRSLHLRWFSHFALHRTVEQIVSQREDIADRVAEGRVLRALTRAEEGADLLDAASMALGGDSRPMLVLRLRSATLVEPDELGAFLLHELMHVGDMVDPSFGYQRSLPASDDGPSGDNILRDRYRVLWDVTIDGRLARARHHGRGSHDRRGVRLPASALGYGAAKPKREMREGWQPDRSDPTREARWQEFAATFSMLGERCRDAFDEWFDRIRPTHQSLVTFALAPSVSGSPNNGDSGRCPLCRFPVASLDPLPERLSAATEEAIRINHPAWRVEQGLCSQCLDLYEARYGATSDVGRR